MRRALAAIIIVLGLASGVTLIGIFADWYSTVEIVILVAVLVACAVVGHYLEGQVARREMPAGMARDYESAQAVTVHLRDVAFPEETGPPCDLMELEMLLEEALEKDALGWYDGEEVGPDEAILFLYGPDAEALFAAVEPVLRSCPMSRNARVDIQKNGPDGPPRTVMLGGAA